MSDTNTPTSSTGSRNTMMALGGVALVGVGLAAGLLMRSPSQNASAPAEAASAAMQASAVQDGLAPTANGTPNTANGTSGSAQGGHESIKAARRHQAQGQPQLTGGEAAPAQAAAPVCDTCGTVDHVRAIQKEGEGSGVGAVAGGVLGGVVGNQMGKGNGKTAMTVLGAIGGGLAGNEIEKRQKAETVYEISVRMDNGNVRTFTQKASMASGTRVEVRGGALHTLRD